MKKYLLYLLLLCPIGAYSQNSWDLGNIKFVERLLNSDNVPILSDTYIVFVNVPYCMIIFEDNKSGKYYTLYYKQDFDFLKRSNVFVPLNSGVEKARKKSMLYKMFNDQSDCISEFLPDSIIKYGIYAEKPHSWFSYFVLYKEGQKVCEFNYPSLQHITGIILKNKKRYSYMLDKLIKNAAFPDFYMYMKED